MKTLTDYKIILRPDDNGTFIAYVPAIKGCHAWGENPEEARSELNHVFEMIRDEYLEAGQLLPNDVEILVSHAS
jgi:predicted RNase H-like HicB family nuclease